MRAQSIGFLSFYPPDPLGPAQGPGMLLLASQVTEGHVLGPPLAPAMPLPRRAPPLLLENHIVWDGGRPGRCRARCPGNQSLGVRVPSLLQPLPSGLSNMSAFRAL